MSDSFSWQSGLTWVQQEWLYDLCLYSIVALLGTSGMFILHFITSMMAYYGAAMINKAKSFCLYLLFTFVAFMVLPLNRGNRPSEFSSWFFILTIWMWRNLKNHGAIWLFPLAIFLANFHGGTIMTVMIMLVILSFTELLCEYVKYKDIKQLKLLTNIHPLASFFAGSFVCPSFYRMWTISPFLPGWNSTPHIQEWMPWEPGYAGGFLMLALTLSLGYGLYKNHFSKSTMQDTAILCAFMIATMASKKPGNILFVLMITLGYPYFENMVTDFLSFICNDPLKKARLKICPPNWAVFLFCIILSVIFGTAGNYEKDFNAHVNKEHSQTILAALKELPPDTRILNGYLEGNVLLFNDIKCYIDTRQFPYASEYDGNTSLDDYISSLQAEQPDMDSIASFIQSYDFEYLYVTDTMESLSWYLNYADTPYVCVIEDDAKGEFLWEKQF